MMMCTRFSVVCVFLLALAGCGGGGSSDDGGGGSVTSAGTSNEQAISAPEEQVGRDPEPEVSAPEDTPAEMPVESGPPARRITQVQINSTDSLQDAASVTFGQVFAKGDVPAGAQVVASVGKRPVTSQVDQKATWGDGSLRHAVITLRIDADTVRKSPAVAIGVVKDRDVKRAPASSAVTLQSLLGTSFDASATLTVNGKEYRVSARDALSQLASGADCPDWGTPTCKQWLSGPLVSEWIVAAPLTDAPSAVANLHVYFHVRAYANDSGGIKNVRVDTVLENAQAYAKSPRNVAYTARIAVGDQSFKSKPLTHYKQARWHKTLWSRDRPSIYVKVDADYLQASRAISRYATLAPGRSFLQGVRQATAPMGHGDQTQHMGMTGAQAAIGPLPRWTSTYVVSGDPRAFKWMMANDDAAGSYAFHYRDHDTGRPLRITDHPYVTLANYSFASRAGDSGYKGDLLPKCNADCKTPLTFDISHHPSVGYVAYLVTGDYYYLEEMQFVASYVELWGNPEYRNFGKGRLRKAQSQMRGQAWALRSISDAAFATPDGDPMKTYFADQIASIVADYNAFYVDSKTSNPLHVVNDKGSVIYPMNGQQKVGISPWQADFFLWAVGHAAEQEIPGAARFQAWLSKFQVERMTGWKADPEKGFCWLQASGYAMQIRDSEGAPIYADMNEVYRRSFGYLSGLACNQQPMINKMSSSARRYRIGEMQGYADSPTGFPSNFQIALAMAADSGIRDAREAWRIFAGRVVKPDYRNFANFAVVPRSID